MKIKNYFIFAYSILAIFIFFYTLTVNLNLDRTLNIVNMGLLFIIFLLWLFAWYLFFSKDILKSNQQERNGISLVLILLAIVFFYYNPLPNPDNFYVNISRYVYFIVTLIFFISFLILAKGKEFFISGILALVPITIQSFFINILEQNKFFIKYPYFITASILFLLTAYFSYRQLIAKKPKK